MVATIAVFSVCLGSDGVEYRAARRCNNCDSGGLWLGAGSVDLKIVVLTEVVVGLGICMDAPCKK